MPFVGVKIIGLGLKTSAGITDSGREDGRSGDANFGKRRSLMEVTVTFPSPNLPFFSLLRFRAVNNAAEGTLINGSYEMSDFDGLIIW